MYKCWIRFSHQQMIWIKFLIYNLCYMLSFGGAHIEFLYIIISLVDRNIRVLILSTIKKSKNHVIKLIHSVLGIR